jgi:hypothetical protein
MSFDKSGAAFQSRSRYVTGSDPRLSSPLDVCPCERIPSFHSRSLSRKLWERKAGLAREELGRKDLRADMDPSRLEVDPIAGEPDRLLVCELVDHPGNDLPAL